jgi:hypothetical protein
MMKLALQSEAYAPTGNISGIGVERSLGTPTLDRLQLVIREAVQNSWDARLDDEAALRFYIRLRSLTKEQRATLRGLLSDLPPAGDSVQQIRRSLHKDDLCVLELADFGTTGLGGPVRADRTASPDEPADFANFFRNVGSPRDKHLGGGTYGYGKSSTYALSLCRTIIAYTQATNSGRPVTRLMAASIGNPFQHRKKRFTGRHWWGTVGDESIVDPVQGEAAHKAAFGIGLRRRSADERGTTILILDPNLEPRSLQQTANAVVESVLWFFWPKMVKGKHGTSAIRFDVELNGETVEIPPVSSFPPLAQFTEAIGVLKSNGGSEIRCERPIKLLGRLALARGAKLPRRNLDTGDEVPLIPEQSSHIALMRPAELVVRYIQGPPLPSDLVEYGGVFICDEGVEPDFAAAEPPAHDDWVPDNLEGYSRTYVRVALKRLHDALARYAAPGEVTTDKGLQQSLALLGDALGGVLIGQSGQRTAESQRPSKAHLRNRRTEDVSISVPEPFRFAIVKKVPCALFRVRLSGKSRRDTVLCAHPFIVLEGGSSPEAAGYNSPAVIAWLSSDGQHLSKNAVVRVRVEADMNVLIAVSIPGDCAVGVNISNQANA